MAIIDRKERINEEIRDSSVRVIDENGIQLGIMTNDSALELAYSKGLDLIELNSKVSPAICKIYEYSKYIYQKNKSKKEQKAPKVKEVKFTSNIADNDINYRIKNIKEFLTENHKVKLTMVFKGRNIMYPDIGRKKMERVIDEIKEYGTLQFELKFEDRNLITIINPIKR